MRWACQLDTSADDINPESNKALAVMLELFAESFGAAEINRTSDLLNINSRSQPAKNPARGEWSSTESFGLQAIASGEGHPTPIRFFMSLSGIFVRNASYVMPT